MTLPSRFRVIFPRDQTFARPKAGGGLTLSKTIQPDWNWAVTLSYDNSPTLSRSLSPSDWSVLGRIAWKPSHDAEITFTQDGWHGKSTLGVASEGSTADGHYGVKADIQRDPTQANTEDQADLSANYSGTASISLRRELDGFSAQPATFRAMSARYREPAPSPLPTSISRSAGRSRTASRSSFPMTRSIRRPCTCRARPFRGRGLTAWVRRLCRTFHRTLVRSFRSRPRISRRVRSGVRHFRCASRLQERLCSNGRLGTRRDGHGQS